MSDVGDYLWANYYSRMPPPAGKTFNRDLLENNLRGYKDHLVIIRNKGKIKGVAVYFTISDESYQMLDALDLSTEDIVRSLADEHGDNAHFILVCGGGYATIRMGIRALKQKKRFKTISWWNPDMTKLHKFKLEED